MSLQRKEILAEPAKTVPSPFPLCIQISNTALFSITSSGPLDTSVLPLCSPHSVSLPFACQTWETAWWLQSAASSFMCKYCLRSWCRINWRHKKERCSEVLTEQGSSRRWQNKRFEFHALPHWGSESENAELLKCLPWTWWNLCSGSSGGLACSVACISPTHPRPWHPHVQHTVKNTVWMSTVQRVTWVFVFVCLFPLCQLLGTLIVCLVSTFIPQKY